MPVIQYIAKRFSRKNISIISDANEIIREYIDKGFVLTLRQLFYQFVSRELIENTMNSYKNLGNVISDARLAGLIDWSAIEDRTRNIVTNSHWDSPAEILRSAADSYKIDRWKNQKFRVEVWIEKEALSGVVDGVCRRLDVPYIACRGYMSQSEMWERSIVLNRYFIKKDQTPVIIHLGDHDPSGIDMTRDITDRFKIFKADSVIINRIALTMDQIQQYNPPPNPAKTTDSRFDSYIKNYGKDSWELDALGPEIIVGLIEETVEKYIDRDQMEADIAFEEEGRERLIKVSDEWES